MLGFREVDINTSEHKTHSGFSSSLYLSTVKPYFKYDSSYPIFLEAIVNLKMANKAIIINWKKEFLFFK